MPIPQLQTNNLDVSNTLFNLANLKQQQQQRDIDNARNAQQDTRQNALYKIQEQREQLQLKKAMNDSFTEDAAVLYGTPDENVIDTYNQMGNYWKQYGRVFPAISTFNNDPKKIKEYMKQSAMSLKLLEKAGNPIEVIRANPNYKPNEPLSQTNFPAWKVKGITNISGGIDEIESTPTITEVEKEARQEKRDAATAERQKETSAIGWANVAVQKEKMAQKKSEKNKSNIKAYYDPYTKTTKNYDLNNPKDIETLKKAGVAFDKSGGKQGIYNLQEVSSLKKQDIEDEGGGDLLRGGSKPVVTSKIKKPLGSFDKGK